MIRFIKNIVWNLLNASGLGGPVLLRINSALKDYGWFRSYIEKQSVDAGGNPIPWFTYPFLEFLKTRIRPEFTVFEYGSGNSTQWFARHTASVIAVEHDKSWFDQVKQKLPGNAEVRFRELDDRYVQAVREPDKRFDLIVVDGRKRVKCALFAADFLTPGGILILDNSERQHYEPAKSGLAAKGFKRIDFIGMTAIVGQESCTSIFYRQQNCFGI